jgi:hypothetical protein
MRQGLLALALVLVLAGYAAGAQVETESADLSTTEAKAGGAVCDLCEDMMHWIDARLSPNDTAPEIEAALRAGCNELFADLPYIHTLVRPFV